jgi:type I restriction enzyme S subunit
MSSAGSPADWQVVPLGKVLTRSPRYGINAPAVTRGTGVFTYIRITDIDEYGRFRPHPKVGVAHTDAANYRMAPGQLVFARTGASVGKSYLYDPADGELVFAGFLINIEPNAAVLMPQFLGYFVQTKAYWDWIVKTSVRSGQPGINGREYAALPVPIPPLREQERVINVLRDADADIAALEGVIAKKEDVRTGLMQRLLTGRCRLPGFSGDWIPRSMASLGETYGGLTGKSRDDFGTGNGRYVPFMAVMRDVLVTAADLPRVRVGSDERQRVVLDGDVLFNTSSETPEELAMAAVASGLPPSTYLNSFCFGLRLAPAAEADPLFLAYTFRSSVGRRELLALAQGATRYNLARSQFRRIEVRLPKLEEQRAIVGVLGDADEELASLRVRLAKAHDIKQGLLQQLMTGRTQSAVNQTEELAA